ncbi:MAG: helix-turn-helix domain-containing protein [Parachlamydiaceae bacterium]|nr:helix-turn-helix domain-containing protein [Parachlamydiaceae bacterium]
MAWEKSTVENQRLSLVNAYLNKTERMTNLCLRFKISRKTGYKWLARYIELGEEGLKDQSKALLEPSSLYTKTQIGTA